MILQTFQSKRGPYRVYASDPSEADYQAWREAIRLRLERIETLLSAPVKPYRKPVLGRCARVRANIKAKYAQAKS